MNRRELLECKAQIDGELRKLDAENTKAQDTQNVPVGYRIYGGGENIMSALGTGQAGQGCARISCGELLRERAKELRNRAADLEALADMLPPALAAFSPQADHALWTLVQQLRIA